MLRSLRNTVFKAPSAVSLEWDNFRGGWNNQLRPTELEKNELVQATNLMLTGKGVPTKRWGSDNLFLASATGYGRGLVSVKKSDGTIELLTITDQGILTKQSNASYTNITGVSWASGYNLEGTQLDDRVYFVNGQRELVRYDFSTLQGFATLAIPTGVAASNISGATGTTTYSYRITAVSQVGETLGSTAISFASLPQDLSQTLIFLQWTPVSAASGVLSGYNIYRGAPGDETFLASVDNLTTRYWDYGDPASLLRILPLADTTGGPIAKYIIRYKDRLILAGIPNDPTRVMISGRVPYHERFDWSSGGGSVLVGPDEGEEITGIAVQNDKIIVFKERSVYEVSLNTVQFGGFVILDPTYQLITASQGCSSHRSITPVENDLFFANREGIYILGYEPNILNVLRTNELSAKIRPFFATLGEADIKNCTGAFEDNKFILSFPVTKKTIIFDRERIAFMGPWLTPYGINKLTTHEDSDGIVRLVASDSTDNYVSYFSSDLTDDKGTAFTTSLKTKKEDFGAWELFKTINDMYLQFRNINGTVDVNINAELRDGDFETISSFEITGSSQAGTSGWGTDMWGTTQWGFTENSVSNTSTEELTRRAILSKSIRLFQVEVTTTAGEDNYELLGIKTEVRPQGPGGVPHMWTVT